MGKLLEREAEPSPEKRLRTAGPTPIDDTDILDWDVGIEAPPRPSKTIRVRLVYVGRAKPMPFPDPEE